MIFLVLLNSLVLKASEGESKGKKFNAVETIMHHIQDAHEWHLFGEGETSATLPLPVILYTNGNLVSFMSSEFHHDDSGKHIVEKNGQKFVKYHEKIYYAREINEHGSYIESSKDGHTVLNDKPIDFSITKNVLAIFISAIIMLLVFTNMAGAYKKRFMPKSTLGKALEPLILYIRDNVIIPNIGEKNATAFTPFLLTVFFFIWINNLLGLLPGSANVTGNIAVTMVLALITLVVTNINGKSGYWSHIFTPHVPKLLYPIMIPVEIMGILTKPFALMMRLFANITAGHIMILSLISLIFIFKSEYVAFGSIPLALFVYTLELLVAALQAYIFTVLTALYIGMALQEKEHH
ncbi:MAG: F0F1 ATP synthase subunit A [Solirubrobacteraceae bacterium]